MSVEDKLMAMAMQDVSPNERDNARRMLAKKGLWPPKPDTQTAAGRKPWSIRWAAIDLAKDVTMAELITAATRAARAAGHATLDGIRVLSYEEWQTAVTYVEVRGLVPDVPFGETPRSARDFEREMDAWDRTMNSNSETIARLTRQLRQQAEQAERDYKALHREERAAGTVSRTSFIHTAGAGNGSFIGRRRDG